MKNRKNNIFYSLAYENSENILDIVCLVISETVSLPNCAKNCICKKENKFISSNNTFKNKIIITTCCQKLLFIDFSSNIIKPS